MARDAQLVGLLQASAIASNEAPDIHTAATTCLDEIRRVTGWPLGHLYLASRDGKRLEPSGVWSAADPDRFAAFQDVTNHLTLDSGHGMPGRVLQSGRAHWIIDPPKDRNFPRVKVAEQVGLRAVFAFPILSGTSVVGVLEFFADEAAPPDGSLLDVLGQVGRQLGRVVERQRAAETEALARQQEEQLRQAAKMEATGQLAAGIAHDVNNVLTAIYASTHMLAERLPHDSDMHEYVNEIREAATRAADMTQHLLAFGRRQMLQIETVDLNAEIWQLKKILSRLLPESIQVELKLSDDLPSVPADHAQMQQVILNLAVNARDAMPRGGRLLIETMVVTLDAEYVRQHVGATIGTRVLLAITDTGVGMDAATQVRIFEPYFTTKGRKGTGIGLATVYGIVKQSGGDIWVYSEPDRGTTFKIYLPICDAPVAASAQRRDAGDRTAKGSETLVLVENDEPIRRVTARILRSHGYAVLEAASAEEAMLIEPAVRDSASTSRLVI